MSQETDAGGSVSQRAGRMYAGQPVVDRQRQRRARFLESGLTVFARDGYANSPVGAICKAAGLSSRQFYEEFTGRESLLLELYEDIDRHSRHAVEAALTAHAGDSVAEQVDAAVRVYIESVARDPRRARLVLVEVMGAGPTVEKCRLQLRQAWGVLLAGAAEQAAAKGEIPPGDYEMRSVAIIGAVNYVVDAWSCADPRPPLDTIIAVLRRVIIGAVRA